MVDATDWTDKKLLPGYVPVTSAPFIYFDYVPTHGILGGAVQIELAARIIVPLEDGGVQTHTIDTARLRCSPTAARFLKDSLEAALKMLEQPQASPSAASKMN